MVVIRGLPYVLPSLISRGAVRHQASLFHTSRPNFLDVGNDLPDLDVLVENSPGNKVNLSKELTGRGLVIGVPAAFSMFKFSHAVLCAARVIYHHVTWLVSDRSV